MSEQLLNTREVAAYLGIHEKQVYLLAKDGRIPATKLTGKWTFPRKLIDEWLEADARGGLEQARRKSRRMAGALLASGSNDPIMEILQTYLRKAHPEVYLFTANTGSTEGLRALNAGYTDIAWSHLLDPASGEYNIPFLGDYLPSLKPVVVNLFHRDLGFLTPRENPLGIRGFEDLAREEVVFINRQAGSGTRVLLDLNLGKLGIPPETIRGYDQEVYTHHEVGLAILSGEAETGIATSAVARLLGLSFIPITRERFDMVLDRATFFEKPFQALVEMLSADEFRERVSRIGNYDFSQSGKIIHSAH